MQDEIVIGQLSAIAHRTRLGVFRLLVRAGPEGVPAGEIARELGVPATTMSTHLGILTHAGLVAPRRDSRTVFYSLQPEAVRSLFEFLMSDCCQGRPELCADVLNSASCSPRRSRK